jgi:predicted transcriptional regulator
VSAVKLPLFWSSSPANWFRSVEAMFVLKKITDLLDKYYLVLTSLSEHQVDLVSNVVEEEPNKTSNTKMKAVLVSTNTLSPYQMLCFCWQMCGSK